MLERVIARVNISNRARGTGNFDRYQNTRVPHIFVVNR
jgi:hypothetical protein